MRLGFTLVELSIVLVVIGLLVGGILAAQSMTSTAKAQKVIRELQQYQIMADQFGSQFKFFPGDFPKATATFGTAACVYSTTGNLGSCDGNGDGLINIGANGFQIEPVRFWLELKIANFLSNFDTDGGGDHGRYSNPTSTPASSYAKNARWAVGIPTNGQNYAKGDPTKNYLELTSGGSYDGTLIPGTPLIKPANAAAIDAKIDDGFPYSGEVLGSNWWGALDIYGNCGGLYSYNNNYYQVTYNNDANGCNMAFLLKQNW